MSHLLPEPVLTKIFRLEASLGEVLEVGEVVSRGDGESSSSPAARSPDPNSTERSSREPRRLADPATRWCRAWGCPLDTANRSR